MTRKEKAEEEEKSKKREIRKRGANVLFIKAGGSARGRGGMKAGQQKRKLTAGVKVLSDSQFVSSDHLS